MPAAPINPLEEFYDRLPEEQRLIALILRELIHETLPGVHEKMSWGSPFFNGRRNVCYFWVPTKRGKRTTHTFGICFNFAGQIDHGGYLDMAERKRYGCRYFASAEELNVDRLRKILVAAWALNGH